MQIYWLHKPLSLQSAAMVSSKQLYSTLKFRITAHKAQRGSSIFKYMFSQFKMSLL